MMLRRLSVLLLYAAALGAAPTRVADPMKLLGWMPGTWTCSAAIGGRHEVYTAVFSYAMNGAWIRERDTWAAGGDELLLTYVAAKHVWRAVVTESNGSVTVFEAPDTGLAHIAYRSIYPNASMRDTFDRVSFKEYRMHFEQRTGGKLVRGSDVCTKR